MAKVGEDGGRYPWIRRVHAIGSVPQVDRFGWLEDLPWARAGVPLAGRRKDKLLVVLGERGCGKSDLITEEAAALQSKGHVAELVDLSARGRFYEAVSARRDLGAVLERASVGDPGYVLLDSLDEGLDRLGVLDDILVGCLEELGREGRSRLRLRIACRSGRWPRGLEGHLQSLWAPEEVSVVGVTPLTRSDVETAAACDRLDGRRVTRRLEQKGAVALAWSPITLKPLLKAEREGGDLPSTVADAYRLACRQLSSHGHRDGNPLAPDHLTALASRVAAAMQFGHYAAIHDTPSAIETDVALADLDGGDEPGVAGVAYHCGMQELLALVDSGLMVEVGLRRWAFAHDSYQQYLAAQFLARHHMHEASQGQLLWIGDGTSRHVVARHREVAAWRVVDDTELFAEVLRYDPEVLLLADLTALRNQQREAVVDRLLNLVSSDDTVELDRGLLHRLKHPGLSSQLRPHLSLPAAPPLLSTVLRIVRACQLPELNDQLLTVAETQGIDPKLRRLAVQALGDELDVGHVARLRALAEHNDADLGRLPVLEQDPERLALLRALAWRGDADLAAAALERLWPQHLRLPEFLDLIPPADDPTHVRSAWLLIHKVPNLLRPEDVDDAVAWATRTVGSRHPRAGLTLSGESQLSVRLPVRILAQAIALFDEDDTNSDSARRNGRLDQVADALLTLAGRADFDDRHQLAQPVGEVLLTRPGIRRELGQRVLERGDDHQVTRLLSWSGSPALFSTDDSVYWTLQWPTLSPDARRHAEWLVTAWPDPADPDLPSALELRERHPDLKAATARWDTRTEEEDRQQREQEEQRHRLAFNEARLRLALTALSTEEGPPEPLWQHITTELYRTADGSQAPPDRLGVVAAAPSFPHEGSELHRLLLDAAVTVARRSAAINGAAATPATADWNRTATALTALALLDASHLAEAFDHQPRRAAVAAMALAAHDCHHSDDTALRHSLITQCGRLAGHELPTLLHEALDGCSEPELNSLATAFARTAVPDAVQTLRDWANDPGRTDVQWAGVLTSLALAGDRPAQEILSATVTDPDLQRDAARSSSRWTRAAAALMGQPQLPEIWPAIRATLATPDALAALLERLIATDPKGTWPPGTGQLPEADLADLYTMVTDYIGITRLLDYQFEGGFYTDARSNLHRGLLGLLTSKTSPEAVRELTGLATRYPELANLRRHAKATAREVAELQAPPLAPEQLRRLAADTNLRTATDARHLQDIVLASLDRLQTVLQGSNGLVVNLWNRNRATVDHTDWWPCWEEDFSDMVAALLRQDIGGSRVVINREVQVDRSGFPGRRTDIQIQATAPPTSSSDDTLTVVIECKGCWHRDLSTALADQLVRDYLRAPSTAGIYLIGYFDCDRWNLEMRRKRHHTSGDHTIRDLQHGQDARAQEQRDQYGAIVAAKVLDCRLPGANDPWRAEPHNPPARTT